jgi:hypothetical protein
MNTSAAHDEALPRGRSEPVEYSAAVEGVR